MKFLLTLAVLVIAVKWWLSRQKRPTRPVPPPASSAPVPPPAPTPMCACAHCGLMLPQGEAWRDEQGRAFCGAEHRHLGPRP
ncbi:hypothetical protein KAK06_02680 [Ideonella sp. 4Y11]|uniref:Uncharacterized protein n=1 Tax=Ideonella aquatica TaxID=2824119 RepID=A0A941BJU1_9BURK|nr:PP0621 family protein [Ideonella aquatica]MBQ0957854.1 hypothetical protein [Ideonella aquatica]